MQFRIKLHYVAHQAALEAERRTEVAFESFLPGNPVQANHRCVSNSVYFGNANVNEAC